MGSHDLGRISEPKTGCVLQAGTCVNREEEHGVLRLTGWHYLFPTHRQKMLTIRHLQLLLPPAEINCYAISLAIVLHTVTTPID